MGAGFRKPRACLSVFVAVLVFFSLLFLNISSSAMEMDHSHHLSMSLDSKGMTMNNNTDMLPRNCPQRGPDVSFTVYAGTEYARDFPGTVFGLSQHEYKVAPCSRVTVTFINKDSVRHQWMVHGLPKYLYPQGMFHLEAAGGEQRTGTFIVPEDDKTYLVHCDMAQHMEKGMKGQLVVGKGDGNLWSVPGISSGFQPKKVPLTASAKAAIIFSTVAGLLAALFFIKKGKRKGR